MVGPTTPARPKMTGSSSKTPRTIRKSRQETTVELQKDCDSAVTDIEDNPTDFCGHYFLFQPPEGALDSCIDKLQKEGHINQDGAWVDFGVRRSSERETYDLPTLAANVLSAYPDKREVTCKFKSRPRHITKSETVGSSFMTDTVCACIVSTVPPPIRR
ncbi:hypothetical protein VKT23_015116 [Stygiomarasmius scandens]|uniref:Uncharacterized protein n=1 Tax=Marasmiellus scandens TaxID=2682957 RepID=A0ABR1J1Z8_9AGAR